jgi:hypothetical protein
MAGCFEAGVLRRGKVEMTAMLHFRMRHQSFKF